METGLVREWRLVEPDRRLRLDREPDTRCAVVVAGGDRDRERLAGLDRSLGRRHLDLQLRRHEILDLEFDAADGRRFRIKLQLGMPGAGARIARQRISDLERAQRVAGQLASLDFDAVRPQQTKCHRQAGDRIGFVIAHQRHQVHALAGTVDAAVGVQIRVDRARRRTAADAAIG